MEVMTAYRFRRAPSPPDRRPRRRGGGSSPCTYAASAAGRAAGPVRLSGGRRGLLRSARALTAAALLALAGALVLPAAAQTTDPVWSAIMTVGETNYGPGYDVNEDEGGSLSDDDFQYSSTTYTVELIELDDSYAVSFRVDTDGLPEEDTLTLEIDGLAFPFEDRSNGDEAYWEWDVPEDLSNSDLPIGDRVVVCLRTAAQVCPTSVPSALSVADVSAEEGEDLTFTVELTPASTETVTVDWATSGGTATSGTDFTAGTATLTFTAGDTEQTVTVATTEDMTEEDHETITVTLSNATAATISGATATGVIWNDDGTSATDPVWSTVMTVARTMFHGHGYADPEVFGDAGTFGSLSDNDFDHLSVTYEVYYVEVHPGDGVSFGVDLAGLPEDYALTLEIDGHAFPFEERRDASSASLWEWDVPEDLIDIGTALPIGDRVVVCLRGGAQVCPTSVPSALRRGGRLGGGRRGPDLPGGAVAGEHGDGDGGLGDLGAARRTSGTDFTAGTGTLTFAPGVTEQTVTVATIEDMTDEDHETITVTLSNASAPISGATATGTIKNDDAPPLVWSTTLTVGNHMTGSGNYYGYLSESSTGSLTDTDFEYRSTTYAVDLVTVNTQGEVYFFVDLAGLPEEDTMTLEINGHEFPFEDRESESSNLAWVWDAPEELDEPATEFPVGSMATVCLRTATQVCPTGGIVIPPTVTVADGTATEGSPVTFTVTLSALSGLDVEVDYATTETDPQSATSGTDFTAASGTLTIEEGDETGTIEVQTTEDSTEEEDETFTLTISDPDNATLGAKVAATGTIEDDDANAAPTFSSSATFDAAENQTTAGTVLATDGDTDDDVTGYAITGGADQAFFLIGATSGALTFDDAPNFEDAEDQGANNTYVVEVQATSGTGAREKMATQAITVTVADVDGEKPTAPAAPNVSAASVTSLNVNWTAPANAGPAITDYDVQYRAGTSGGWTDRGYDATATTATITSLAAGTSYQVQVRATNAEGTGDWSASGAGSTYANEAEAQEIALVSNIREAPSGEAAATPENYTGGQESRVAQRFTTGPSTGYGLQSVLLNLTESEGQGGGRVKVGIHRNKDSGNPGRELVVLDNPDPVFGTNRPFSVTSPFSLDAGTSYWVVVSNTGSNRSRFFVSVTASGNETTTQEFEIGDSRNAGKPGSWTDISGEPARMEIRGTVPAQKNPTLSGLSLGTGVMLNPVFASGTTVYTASVPNAVDEVTVTPTKAAASATIEYLNESDMPLTGASTEAGHRVALAVGNTVIKVKVTAADRSTTQTYTVTMTRDAAIPGICSLNTGDLWCGVVTVAEAKYPFGSSLEVTEGYGFTHNDFRAYDAGMLSDTTFALGLNEYTITRILVAVGRSAGTLSFGLAGTGGLPAADIANLELHAGASSFAFSTATYFDQQDANLYAWSDSGLSWSVDDTVTLRLRRRAGGDMPTNNAPVFAATTATRTVPENSTAGTNVGDPVTATDDAGDTLEYSLEGTDATSFAVDSASGQITTIANVDYNHEATKKSYSVTVKASDGTESATIAVTINVTDVAGEAPGKPNAPDVSAASVTSLTVSWSAPANAGPAITDYDVQYREGATGDWSNGNHTGAATTATLSSLSENTSYQVQVRATNDEGTGSWSDSSSGTTDANAAPSFTSSATFDAAENGTEVTMVRAEDSDSEDKIERYDITGGADQAFFLVIASSGHLEFRDAPNFEDAQDQGTDNTYVVEVEATSGTGTREKTATQTITVTVTDVAGEAPGKPNAPDVSAASVTSLTVSWSAPANAGPAITDYDVQYREGATGDWSNGNHTGAATTATLSSLSENTSYQVQVRATNDEGTGSWSDSSSGTTDANAAPSFTSSATFDAAENGTEVTMVRAEDSDSEDKIERYDITGGADQAFFLVIASSGHLEFRDAPNFEDAQDQGTDNTYVVEVEATSGTGTREKTATQTITVTVTDVAGEAPGKPNAPDVSAASVTSLTVSWSAPANAGPAITDYDVQYREGATGDWSNGNHTGAATTATLSSLSENTSYQVQVRATNDEGTGSWSDSSSGTTDANAAPSFTSSATFDAAENGTEVTMVRAEDSDSEDKIERYDITGGADQAFFLVIASSGHLEFRDAPNFEDAEDQGTDNTYVVEVEATSGTGTREKTATQTITVTVTDVSGEKPAAPAAPTVAAASVTSLTVNWSAPANAGPAITDYDVQYREGATGDWSNGNHTGAATTATLSSLSENTSYQVQVRATNDEGTGSWSDSSSGTTDANAAPSFTSSATFDAAENGTEVTMVRAEDSDSEDKIERYDITGGADQAFFLVIASSGHLEFRDAPNFEDAQDQGTDNTYVVEVEATSGTGTREKTATQTITVTVTDVAGRSAGQAECAGCVGCVGDEPDGELVGAGQRRSGHHGLRRAVPGRRHRGLEQRQPHRRRHHGDAVESVGEHVLSSAGAGDQRRGDGLVVGLEQRHDGRQRGPVVHLVGDVRRGGERHGGDHGAGGGQRFGGQDRALRHHRRRGPGVLLGHRVVRASGVQRCAELRGRPGPGDRQHLRGGGRGDQRHGHAGEDGHADDHGGRSRT